MTDNVKVFFTNKGVCDDYVCFHKLEDFLLFLQNNNVKVIEVKSEINEVNEKAAYALYTFINFYKEIKGKCNKYLADYNEELVSQQDGEFRGIAEQFVRMNKDGKCLRAMLVALGYKSAGKDDEYYMSLSKALEIFQTSILIHDDIIDNADMRRGQDTIPTSYKKTYDNPINMNSSFDGKKNNFADSMGICIGDLGFYLANGILLDAYSDDKNFGKLFKYYNDVVIKTCKGEMLDVILPFKEEFFETDADLENKIMEIYRLKTAWYSVIGPYCLGMILGGASSDFIKEMEEILLDAGVAFQIKDDLLGVYGDEKNIGKSTNSDISEYKQTILYSYVMNTEYKDELLKYYGKTLQKEDLEIVKSIFDDSGAKGYALETMQELFNNCVNKIDNLSWLGNEIKAVLEGFIVYLQIRTK